MENKTQNVRKTVPVMRDFPDIKVRTIGEPNPEVAEMLWQAVLEQAVAPLSQVSDIPPLGKDGTG
jgi:hypothetical protein